MSDRIEVDSMGEVKVPNEKHYAAQTVRSMMNFPICNTNAGHKMPKEVIEAMLYIKKAAAITNKELMKKDPKSTEFKKFAPEIADMIIDAIDTILTDLNNFYEENFPLVVWQTGSGTQTNMNVNEVIASVANEKATGKKGGKSPVHPNDHVNLGQSSNDTFPTAMNVATVLLTYKKRKAICTYCKNWKNSHARCNTRYPWAGVFIIQSTNQQCFVKHYSSTITCAFFSTRWNGSWYWLKFSP